MKHNFDIIFLKSEEVMLIFIKLYLFIFVVIYCHKLQVGSCSIIWQHVLNISAIMERLFNCWKWNGNTIEFCMKQHCNMKI